MPDPNPVPAVVNAYFVCQNKRCRQVFHDIKIVKVGNFQKVMIGIVMVEVMRFQCPHCGGRNYYNVNEEKLDEQNKLLLEVLGALHGQKVIESQPNNAIIENENLTG